MCASCKVRDFVPFSSINNKSNDPAWWVTGKGKGHAGTLNARRVHEGLKKCHVIYGQYLWQSISVICCVCLSNVVTEIKRLM